MSTTPSTSEESQIVSTIDAPEFAAAQFVRWFRDVAPYVRAVRGQTFVVGFEGDLIQEGKLESLVHDLSLLTALGVQLVLIYGCLPQANEQIRLRDLDTFQNDFKPHPTNAAIMECFKEASGEIRLDIEAAFSQGLPNTPMSNSNIHIVSGNFAIAQPLGVLEGQDFQHAGKVRKFDLEAIRGAFAMNAIVLMSPIGFSLTGEAFILPMEDLATSAAISLKADKLILITKDNRVRDSQGQVVTELDRAGAEALIGAGQLNEATTNYLSYAAKAVKKGVKRAHLIPYDLDGSILLEYFTHDGVGTMVVEKGLDDVRQATLNDIGAIMSLIAPLEANGTLVPRSRSVIEQHVHDFTVLEHDGVIYGCVALHPYPNEKMAELACLIVHPDWRSSGEGDLLLKHTETKARSMGISQLFALTTQTSHWFVKRGFIKGTIGDLPEAKRLNYNRSRNSLIFTKKL